ncbi:MAG: hypothetical protein WC428_07430 [Candidatus Paceibacterota bacterium]
MDEKDLSLNRDSKEVFLRLNGFYYNKEREQWNAWIDGKKYDIAEELIDNYSYGGLKWWLVDFTGHDTDYNFDHCTRPKGNVGTVY